MHNGLGLYLQVDGSKKKNPRNDSIRSWQLLLIQQRFLLCVRACGVYMQVCSPVQVHMEARGRLHGSSSIDEAIALSYSLDAGFLTELEA